MNQLQNTLFTEVHFQTVLLDELWNDKKSKKELKKVKNYKSEEVPVNTKMVFIRSGSGVSI
jgi:hypothetical protein